MITFADTRAAPRGISLLLAASMCALPFVIPYHQYPILSFYQEWLAAALGLAALAVLVAFRPGRSFVALPAPARWLCAFSALLAITSAFEASVYPQLPLLAAVYVLFAVLMMWLGAQLATSLGLERTVTVLASFILAAALVNAAAGAVQYYGRPAILGELVAELHDPRAYGNIGQANLYANYLALGQAALLYLHARGRLSLLAALPAAMLLAWASALSGSRSALVFAAWLFAMALLAGPRAGDSERRALARASAGMGALVLAAHGAVPLLHEVLGLTSAGTLQRVAQAPLFLHLQAWAMALRVFAESPLIGSGIGQFAGAAWSAGMPPEMASAFMIWTSAHNLVLQLMAETGAIGAALVLGALWSWLRHCARTLLRAWDSAVWAVAALVGLELLHSMTEFPLWSAHFLGTTALLMGTTWGHWRFPGQPLASKFLAGCCGVIIVLVLAFTLRDYWRLDTTRLTGAARTVAGPAAVSEIAVLTRLGGGLLGPVADLWRFSGVVPDRRDLQEKLALSERVMRFYPTPSVVARRAALLALSGQAGEASLALGRFPPIPDAQGASRALLEQASHADPAALAPLIAQFEALQRAQKEKGPR